MSKRNQKAVAAPKRPPPPDDDVIDVENEVETPVRAAELEQLERDDEAAALDGVLADLGASGEAATITVTKIGSKGEERVGRFSLAQFDVDMLRELYGAGSYVIYARVGQRLRGKHKITFAQTADELRGDRVQSLKAAATAAGLAMHAPGAAVGDSQLALVREMYERSAQQQREFMTLMVETVRGRPAADPLELQRSVFTQARELMELRGEGKKSGGDIDTLLKGIELGRRFNGSQEGAGISDVVVEFFRSMGPMLGATAPEAPPVAPAAPAALARPQALSSPSAPPAAPSSGPDRLLRLIAQYTPLLARAAAAGGDPGIYAQLVLDQLPEQAQAGLGMVLARADWWSVLQPYVPQLERHLAWLSAVRSQILEALQPEPTAPEGAEEGGMHEEGTDSAEVSL